MDALTVQDHNILASLRDADLHVAGVARQFVERVVNVRTEKFRRAHAPIVAIDRRWLQAPTEDDER
jgi:hypothetical protein